MPNYEGTNFNDQLIGTDWGDDLMNGNGGSDAIYGFGGNDVIHGNDGDDQLLWGGAGHDSIYGDAGNDTLVGGADWDVLWGGAGSDTFDYTFPSDSGPTWATADVIMDFSQAEDHVDAQVAGSYYNYMEGTIGYDAGFDSALATANSWDTGIESSYVFVTDGVNGYLFGDTVGDAAMDFGVELAGLTSVDQFNHTNII